MNSEFANPATESGYPVREADPSWINFFATKVDVQEKTVLDIGCGEGVYSRAMAQLGARSVLGIDVSEDLLRDARNDSKGIPGLEFRQGDALHLDLDPDQFDVVVVRAVMHHVNGMPRLIAESARNLKKGGTLFIQDRTPEDVLQAASSNHLRGYFFECFPKLVKVEVENRFTELELQSQILMNGCEGVQTLKLSEVRNRYRSREDLEDNLRRRKGRSILSSLEDTELETLIEFVLSKVESFGWDEGPLEEIDRWTVWTASK